MVRLAGSSPGTSRSCEPNRRSSLAIRAATAGSRKDSVPTATSVAPASSRTRACAPDWMPPIPTTGTSTRPHRRDLRERDRPDRRAGQPAGPAAEPRRARSVRVPGHAAQRVDQRHGVGARGLGRLRRTAATSAVFGVSLTISGLRVRGRTARMTRRQLGRVGADVEPGLDVRARDVELDRGDLLARVAGLDQRRRARRASSP